MTPFFMAWGMFFMIPCPVKKWDSGKYPQMLVCMPFIGLLIGLNLIMHGLTYNKVSKMYKMAKRKANR